MLPPVDLTYPFEGSWLTQCSPANPVHSHGTTLFATTFAIDLGPVDEQGRSGTGHPRRTAASRTTRALSWVRAPRPGPGWRAVVADHDGEPGHQSFRGLPSVGYSLTQRRRVARGWAELAGNHVMIQTPEDQLVAVCHLQRGSMRVQPGDDVQPAQTLGRCGNSGNGTGPHVHLQAINRVDVMHAIEVPVTFGVRLPRNREVISTQV